MTLFELGLVEALGLDRSNNILESNIILGDPSSVPVEMEQMLAEQLCKPGTGRSNLREIEPFQPNTATVLDCSWTFSLESSKALLRFSF